MTSSVTPHDNDVLFGRGFTISAHVGNKHLRSVVEAKKSSFLKAKKKQKRNIAKEIVDEIRGLDPPGRFLIEDPNSPNVGDDKLGILDKVWIAVEAEKAVDKVMHRLRERDKADVSRPRRARYQQMMQQQQQQQQHSGDPPSQIASFGTIALPQPGASLSSDDLARFLQNMQQQQLQQQQQQLQHSLGENFLSMAIGQAQQQIYNPQQHANQPIAGMSAAQTIQHVNIMAQAIQHINNTQPQNLPIVGQPIQGLNSLQQPTQNLNVQQHPTFSAQANDGNLLFGSQSAGTSPALLEASIIQKLKQINDQLHSIQQAGTQTNIGTDLTTGISSGPGGQVMHNVLLGPQSAGSSVPMLPGAITSQPIQQINPQQLSVQQVGAQSNIGPAASPASSGTGQPIQPIIYPQQLSIQQVNAQSNIGPVGSPALPGTSPVLSGPGRPIQQINPQQLLIQQAGAQSNIESSGSPSPFASAAGSPGLLSNSEQSYGGRELGPLLRHPNSPTCPPPSISTMSPLYQEVSINEVARSSNNLATSAKVVGETLAADHVGFPNAMDSALYFLSSDRDKCAAISQQQFGLVTLREWIDQSMPRFVDKSRTPGHLTAEMSSYITSAIPLAIKLTEFLMETENEEGPASMADITCENVLVQLKDSFGSLDSIDQVMIIDVDRGPKMNTPHLLSLGVILYEVFSFRPGQEAVNAMAESSVSVEGVDLSKEAMVCDRPSKKSQRNPSSSRSGIVHGETIANLEALGIPWSLRALVGNLLDCVRGDLRGDDAYRSLAEVRVDLRLMRDDPARYLDDVQFGASLEVGNRFYGREGDISSIEKTYHRHVGRGCVGIVVSGGAGVGKSSLVSATTKDLASQAGAFFLEARFGQNEGARPLLVIEASFNVLCDLFAQDASQSELEMVAATLRSTLGDKAAILVGVLPSLAKLIPCPAGVTSNECIDPAASMQFLFRKLLEALSEHRRVSFFLDDLQYADPASLNLISSMLSNTKENSRVFFACCYRDGDDGFQEDGPFASWLSSISIFPLEMMELKNMSTEGVNDLVSATLHLSPRITRPLASTLHHKTRGNPLFLRQLLDLLNDQGYIYLSFSPVRWAWDIDKIADLEISDNVVTLLINEMQRLHGDLQLGLKVASCMGSCVRYSIFDILSQDLGVNLGDVLDQATQEGYMVHVDETKIRFAHDKIQQAAYGMLTAQQQIENHMRFGLALTSHALNGGAENDELFFVAIHQINRGGPSVLADSKQKDMVASLNLKAGKRSMELSDFSTALSYFEHGIEFLDSGQCWTTQYALAIELYDAAVETACALNDAVAVRRLSEIVLAQAKCNDDKLNCLYAVVKSLRLAYKMQDSQRVAFTMLEQLGEKLPRPMDDIGLAANIQEMKLILLDTPDESILNLEETNQKKRDILMLNLYHDLIFVFQFVDTKRIADASLRMAQITLSNGLCCMSPVAFAQFAIILVTTGDADLGYRLGTLALRLLDKVNAQRYTSAVIALVGSLVSWVAEPLQSIADSHLLGYKCGQRNGDEVSEALNYQFYLLVSYISGQSLSVTRVESREFAQKILQRKQKFMFNGSCSIHLQTVAFIEGLEFSDKENGTDKLPSWDGIKSQANSNQDFSLIFSSHLYMRSFLFKQYDEVPEDGLLDCISEKNVPLRPLFHYGIFFEGLVFFQLARQTDDEEHCRKGEAALVFMRNWSKRNQWNFENKYLLLEAEMMNISGYHDQATQLYKDALRSSNEHKFIHEEAIASELAAAFFYERGLIQKSYSFFLHSAKCYTKWGALAIAKRVESDILGKFGSDFVQLEPIDDSLASIIASKGSSKKRL